MKISLKVMSLSLLLVPLAVNAQNIPESISNDLVQFELIFSNKNIAELQAIYQNELPKLKILEDIDVLNDPKMALQAIQNSEKVIYCNGKSAYLCDDRKESLLHPNARMRDFSRSVVAFVEKEYLVANGGTYKYDDGVPTLGGRYNPMCTNEPFQSQKALGFCTGFLVGPDLLATAGHCVDGINRGAYAVFDYDFVNGSETELKTSSVFDIEKIIAFKNEGSAGQDWAVVKLAANTDRGSLSIRKSGKIPDAAGLCVIGHPSGIAQKIACNAAVTENTNGNTFLSNLDTYGGNSGSPVFDESTGVVEGILVRGHTDYTQIPLPNGGTCWKSVICGSNQCSGESVTRSAIWSSNVPTEAVVASDTVGCVAGRMYTSPDCGSGYFEDGVYYHPK